MGYFEDKDGNANKFDQFILISISFGSKIISSPISNLEIIFKTAVLSKFEKAQIKITLVLEKISYLSRGYLLHGKSREYR